MNIGPALSTLSVRLDVHLRFQTETLPAHPHDGQSSRLASWRTAALRMFYLIGGASRAGKTILAGRLLTHHGVAWFSLDVLRMGLHRGVPGLGLDADCDDLEEADHLWPVVRAIVTNLLEYRLDYSFEGACLRPEHAAEAVAAYPGQVKACFLGYPGLAATAKAEFIRTHAGGPNDWLSDSPPEEIGGFAAHAIVRSALLATTCKTLGLPFFDTGTAFEANILAAERRLVTRP